MPLTKTVAALLCLASYLYVPSAPAATPEQLYQDGDYARAVAELRPMAVRGDREAQYFMGLMYLMGQGLAANPPVGADYMRKAAQQGHALAAESLAKMYMSGLGVAKNEAKAIHWLEESSRLMLGGKEDTEDSEVECD